jgi:NAD(P)-dependent dehydrogenase (short-subunit alcohol dehydrogenase family)
MSEMKTILITGATAGIGKHAAIALARKGHRVFATGRNPEALAKLAAEAALPTLETLRLDVTDLGSIAEAAAEVDRRTFGRGLDALVNNAGYGQAGPLEEITDADLRAQFDTNVFGLMAVTRAFLPRMRERGSGRIVNISSSGGRISLPLFGAYHATKYAVEALSDSLRIELAHMGVGVVIIEPGAIKTEFGNRVVHEISKYRRPDSRYAALYERAVSLKERIESFAAAPEVVTHAIEKAITARRPRARYVMPFSTKFGLWLSGFFPTFVLDALLERAFGLKNLVATPTTAPASPPAAPQAARELLNAAS